ncbi:hypothetical protein BN874_160005 [Candidatus Contendobacter odensis Run_B_J11]|uniref:Uncharacterized protein n=2 Tax=Candidatus Contendibacter odensensis TaxID=1400860 RepID=A0A7U7J364_9GAMM|nr:hypothetical protein [Candidatus Competibacteraceae bacterium]CDH44249.1 hypothetical protein BN874_160005 [Candidatus Contendobacter odensis Run_B_J11]
MYAHRVIQSLNGLHVQFDLPPEFADCQEAEIIVLPVKSTKSNSQSWEQWVRSVAGTLSDDFPDDITDDDLGVDAPRESLE